MKKTKVLVTGSNSAVGVDLLPMLERSGFELIATSLHPQQDYRILDITDLDKVNQAITQIKPDWVVHLAAMTNVEACDLDPKLALLVNGVGAGNVAKVADKVGSRVIYISTGAVFDGTQERLYQENDKKNPVNGYGKSKLAGEIVVKQVNPKNVIIRAGWLVGGGVKDKKFVGVIGRLINSGQKKLSVVTDKKGTLTYTKDLSALIEKIIIDQVEGTYHFSTNGWVTRFEVAQEMAKLLADSKLKVEPLKSKALKDQFFAERPQNEGLANNKIKKIYPALVRDWREILVDYFQQTNHFKSL